MGLCRLSVTSTVSMQELVPSLFKCYAAACGVIPFCRCGTGCLHRYSQARCGADVGEMWADVLILHMHARCIRCHFETGIH